MVVPRRVFDQAARCVVVVHAQPGFRAESEPARAGAGVAAGQPGLGDLDVPVGQLSSAHAAAAGLTIHAVQLSSTVEVCDFSLSSCWLLEQRCGRCVSPSRRGSRQYAPNAQSGRRGRSTGVSVMDMVVSPWCSAVYSVCWRRRRGAKSRTASACGVRSSLITEAIRPSFGRAARVWSAPGLPRARGARRAAGRASRRVTVRRRPRPQKVERPRNAASAPRGDAVSRRGRTRRRAVVEAERGRGRGRRAWTTGRTPDRAHVRTSPAGLAADRRRRRRSVSGVDASTMHEPDDTP